MVETVLISMNVKTTYNNCDVNANCANTVGNFTCTCLNGYEGNGTHCEDINECDANTHNCDTNALCNNTMGGFECACAPGYIGPAYCT